MSARQAWASWFLTIERLNGGASRHEFPTKSIFVGDRIVATCARCGSSFSSKCSKETGPYSTEEAWYISACDFEMALDAKWATEVDVVR